MTIAVGQVGTVSGTISGSPAVIQTAAVNTSNAGTSGFTIQVLSLSTAGLISWAATDSFANTYTHLSQETFAAGGGTYAIDTFYCAAGATGGTGHQANLTGTVSNGASYRGLYLAALIEETNAANSNIYDQTNSQSYAYSTSPPYASTGLTVSPPSTGIMLISSAIISEGSPGQTPSESTGFTIQATYDAAVAVSMGIATKVVTSSGTYTPSWTASGGVEAFIGIESFKGFVAGTVSPSAGSAALAGQSAKAVYGTVILPKTA